jgi:hypothetical protein
MEKRWPRKDPPAALASSTRICNVHVTCRSCAIAADHRTLDSYVDVLSRIVQQAHHVSSLQSFPKPCRAADISDHLIRCSS